MNSLLAKVLFRERTRFFHKLECPRRNHRGTCRRKPDAVIVRDVSEAMSRSRQRAWRELEVLGYDLNTCMGETTVVLKSFFCALPAEELEAFRQKLVKQVPALLAASPGRDAIFR